MKVSRTVAYALRATLQLANQRTRNPVPCSRLAAEGKMPERFLLQILRSLVNHGILRSTRGVEGGYTLVRSPQDVSLLEVIEAVEGPLDDRPLESGFPEDSQDKIRDALQVVTDTTRQQLDRIKFSDLLPDGALVSGDNGRAAAPTSPPRSVNRPR